MTAIRERFAARLRRRFVLAAYAALLIVVLLATAVYIVAVLPRSHLALSDKLALAGDAAAAGTLLLAVIGGLVALQAYAAATGLPALAVQVWFARSAKNHPVFRGGRTADGYLETASLPGQTIATIRVRNRGDYSANNPAVILRLSGMSFDLPGDYPDWAVLESDISGVTAVQWDGGPMYSIHGGSARRLPPLDLYRLRYLPTSGQPLLTVELLADGGYRRTVSLGVRFTIAEKVYGDQKPDTAAEWI